MVNERAAIAALERDGYVILPELLSPSECAELARELAPWEAARPHGRNPFEGEKSKRIYSLAAKGERFLALAEQPAVVALLEQLLLPNWLLSTMQSIRLYPGESEQPWHTDDTFYPVPRPRARLAVSVIWAIEEFTADNGATELVPGSHLWAHEHPEDAPRKTVQAIMPAGSALLFDGALWHRGGANRSTGTRLCISPQYCQPWLRPQESQLLIVPPARARDCSARLRSMLGYNIHPPFIGQVDGMHPLRLVDPDYRERKSEAAQLADEMLARPEPTRPARR